MPVRPWTAEEEARIDAAIAEEYTLEPPRIGNVTNARHMAEPEVLEFRGKEYLVPPTSGLAGLRLMELSAEWEAASHAVAGPGSFRTFVRAYRNVVRELGRLARPHGWRGVLWRIRPNPFRHATMQEVRDLLGFFGRCQTTSSVRHRLDSGSSHPSTSSP